MDSLAARYAVALFDLALEGQAVVAFQKEIKEVHAIVKENSDLLTLLSHYNIANEDKKSLINKVFKNQLSQLTLNFLNLLIDKKRINVLAKICEEFNSLANKQRGIQEGTVYSSVKLSSESLAQIKQKIEKENHTEVELTNIVDEKLIGGFKVVIKDTVYDNSLKNKIDSLRYELLEGKR